MKLKESLNLINEEYLVSDKLASVDKLILYDIFKNPKMEELGESKDNKGFIDDSGNLYLVVADDDSDVVSYTAILKTLMVKGEMRGEIERNLANNGFGNSGIAIQRNRKTNEIAIANFVNADMVKRFEEEIKELFRICGKINEEYQFVFASVENLKVNTEGGSNNNGQ